MAALATAALLARGDSRACLTAAAGGALLLTDAWFDVCTSAPGLDQRLAVAEAVLVELPLAGAAGVRVTTALTAPSTASIRCTWAAITSRAETSRRRSIPASVTASVAQVHHALLPLCSGPPRLAGGGPGIRRNAGLTDG
jgi:hypothetical protein